MRLFLILSLAFLCACGQTTIPESETNTIESNPIENADLNAENTANSGAPENQTANEPPQENEDAVGEFNDIDWVEYEKSMTKDFSFVILISTKSYDAALERAKDASEKLGYPLDLRDLHPNAEIGLSLPKEVCEGICGGGIEYPQYLPRTDWGESKYVSVEYSNGFKGFATGYYIVVVASGEKGDPIIQEALKESKQFYPDAYSKTCGVWMGCGC